MSPLAERGEVFRVAKDKNEVEICWVSTAVNTLVEFQVTL